MARDLKNKTLAVTGGADGLGFQIAKKYLEEGAKLAILLDIDEEKGNEAVKQLTSEFGDDKAVFIKCDVTKDFEGVYQKICKDFGNIDVLVNSAGISSIKFPMKCLDINLKATILWSMKFLEHMRENRNDGGGTIINISSILGYRVTFIEPVYHATKFGVVGFTRSLGHEKNFGEHGVRIIAICPGFTKTSLTKDFFEEDANEDVMVVRDTHLWQSAEEVADKAVEVFKKADSGTIWAIEGGVLNEVNF